MIPLGLSLGVSPREDMRRFIQLAKAAEDRGIDTFWVIDSQLAMKDAYVALSIGLWETERLKFGTGVTNLITRDITVTANAMATLSDIGQGRALLGLGAGDSAVFPLGLEPSRIKDLSRGMTDLRHLLHGQEVQLRPDLSARLSFTPTHYPPIYLAASRPRMLDLAGRVADGVIVMGPANAETARGQIEAVRHGEQEAGRPAGSTVIDLWVTIAIDHGDGSAVNDVRSWASAQARHMSHWGTLPSSLEQFKDEMEDAAKTYEFSQHLSLQAGHASSVSNDLARALAVAGTPDQCATRLRELIATGPDRITCTLLSKGREHRLDEIAKLWTVLGNPETASVDTC